MLREVGDYFRRLAGEVEKGVLSAVPPEVRAGTRPFRVPRFTRTLSEWLNLLMDTGGSYSNVWANRALVLQCHFDLVTVHGTISPAKSLGYPRPEPFFAPLAVPTVNCAIGPKVLLW